MELNRAEAQRTCPGYTLQALSGVAPASPGPRPFSDSLSGWVTITANKVVWVGQGGAAD